MSMFRFFIGILIVEVAMVALVMAFMSSSDIAYRAPIAILALLVTVLVVFWFGSITEHVKKDALTRAKDNFVRERENRLIAAEAEKRNMLEETHRRIVKETNQVHARSNFKLGAAFASIIMFGAVMLYIELLTVGLLTLAVAGGALGGYVIRARQDALSYRNNVVHTASHTMDAKVVESSQDGNKRLRHEA
ncbi:MAG: hypothetical protein NTX45_10815 [Proteobacteria bacterium]|nr:hypothetical protein [Pseudomonadota bacterium]